MTRIVVLHRRSLASC